MPNQIPRRLIVEYGDGYRKEVNFSKLSRVAQAELTRMTGSPSLLPLMQVTQKYLLLKWKDGWQEVTSIEADCGEPSRYYVIKRVEESGRLVLERSSDYPELVIIGRRPRQIEKMVILDDKSTKTYALDQDSTTMEGGRTSYHYRLNADDVNYMDEVMASLRKALEGNGIEAKELLALSDTKRARECERIRKKIGLRASGKQEDVLGFIQVMLVVLAEKKHGKL